VTAERKNTSRQHKAQADADQRSAPPVEKSSKKNHINRQNEHRTSNFYYRNAVNPIVFYKTYY